MTRNAEHTPSPQSVVVPREPTNEMWAAGERAFDRDPDLHHETVVANIWSAMLASAPAPSSLAGGDVAEKAKAIMNSLHPEWSKDHGGEAALGWFMDRLAAPSSLAGGERMPGVVSMLKRVVGPTASVRIYEHEAKLILAALSPEAPAQEGVDDLVDRFAVALKAKLHAAEAKYGHNDAWMRDDWLDDLKSKLRHHVFKGDPRDVAAYCAFAWHHGWSVGFDLDQGAPLSALDPFGDRGAARAALTPRHEAPACDDCGSPLNSDGECTRDLAEREADDRHETPASEGDDGPCTCCDDTGITIQTERPCACAAGIPFEAPAEGAGDGMDAYTRHDAIISLRARSSAPEAREGDAVAWVFELATHRDPETGAYSFWNPPQLSFTKPCVPEGSIRNLTPLGPIAHPAALSADKLLEALVDLTSWFTKPVQGQSGMVWVIPAGEMGADDALNAALTALKAEGA